MSHTAKILGAAALILCGYFAGAASAQNAPATGQQPPKPDAGATAQTNCLADSGGFKRNGKFAVYTVELENKCEDRLKCRIDVFVISAKGPSQGHTTMTLAPKSDGAAAKKSYALRVRMLGGMAQSTRECRVF